jgi:integrase
LITWYPSPAFQYQLACHLSGPLPAFNPKPHGLILSAEPWQNIDTEGRELRFVTLKTGRRMSVPLASPLFEYLQTMPAGDNPSDPLFPSAHEVATRTGDAGQLSQQFYAILVSAGMAKERGHEETGAGRSQRRTVSEISFHSLRRTATSLLKNAGVSSAVAMDIIGHETEAINRHYTHIESETKRSALNKLPKLG